MSNSSSLSLDEKATSALCTALGVMATVLVLECLRIPNCYMALSLAVTLSLLPPPSFKQFLNCIMSLSLGIASSMVLLIAFFQAPWVSLPLVIFFATVGYAFFLKRYGSGCAYAFSGYFLAFFIIMSIEKPRSDFTIKGMELWFQSVIPIVITYFTALLTKKPLVAQKNQSLDLAGTISIGLTVGVATLLDFTIQTDQGARLVMASMSTITLLEFGKSIGIYFQQLIGYFVGLAISIAFLVTVIALGNDIITYLLALGTLFGTLDWLSRYFLNYTAIFRGAIAMSSFSVLMAPSPDASFHIPYQRSLTSLIGFLIALFVYLLIHELKRFTQRIIISR